MENHPIKILFLASEPNDKARMRLGEEFREIQNRLKNKDKFQLESSWAVRPQDVLEQIVSQKPQIVHFSGHGENSGELCFEGENKESKPVPPAALAGLFKRVSEYVRCVVVNACFAEHQAKAIAEHIPFVVGTKGEIKEKEAIAFATGFYTALESNQSVEKIEDAFNLGCVQIQLQYSDVTENNLMPILILGDPANRFRSEVEQLGSKLKVTNEISTNIYRKALLEKGKQMGLSAENTERILNDILNLMKEYQQKLQDYDQTFKEAIKIEFPLAEKTLEALRYLQQEYGLRENDIATIERKITSDPRLEKPESFYDRGCAQYRFEEYEEAIKYFNKAIELKPIYSGPYLERAYCYDKLGNMQTAIDDCSEAIRINKNWERRSLGDAYFLRGLLYFGIESDQTLEDPNEYLNLAVNDWTETIKLIPRYSVAYYNRGIANTRLDNDEEAIKDFTQAIDSNNGWSDVTPANAYFRIGAIYEKNSSKNDIAEEYYQKAKDFLTANPQHQDKFYKEDLEYLKLA